MPGDHLGCSHPDLSVPHRVQWPIPRERDFDARASWLPGVAVGGTGGTGFQVIFQLSTSGSFTELYQSNGCTPKTGCSRVMQASDGNLWIANPPGESVYSITTGGTLLQTVSFSSQPNAYAHPQLLIQASSGILYGTTGEPNPAYDDVGSVFSLDAGLPPPQ